MAKHKRKLNTGDAALIERAVAAGSIAYRDDTGRVLALIINDATNLSRTDRKRVCEIIDESDADFLAQGGKIAKSPNPANLIGEEKFYATKKMTDTGLDDAIKMTRFSNAKRRIEELQRHVELHETAEKLAQVIPAEEAWMSRDFRAVIPSDPFWAELAHAEMLAVAYDAAPQVSRDRKRQAGARSGGKRAGRTATNKAALWHAECINRGRELLAAGRQPHELAGILAARFSVTPRQVRNVLQQAGVLSARETEVR